MKNNSKKYTLSFYSVILLSISSCIGAGVFFRNRDILNNNNDNLLWVIFSWSLATIAILATVGTFFELSNKTQIYKNEGIIGWVKYYCGKNFYKGVKKFMFYIYMPTFFLYMSYYCTMSLQDAINIYYSSIRNIAPPNINFMIIILISFVIMSYFFITCSLSHRTSNIQNIILSHIKFIPLAFASIGAIIIYCVYGKAAQSSYALLASAKNLKQNWVGFGVIASVPAIFFAFDGFYSPSASFDRMKSPKKGPMAMAVGTSLVAFIYIMVSLGLLLATNTGTITGLNQISPVIIFIMSLFICFSVMGVINGCVVYYIELTNNWIDDGSIVFAKLIKNKIAKQNVQATAYIMIINFFVFSAFTIIGCFYLNSYTGEYGSVQTERIYTLCDILSDWSSLFVFCFIGAAIAVALIRKIKEKNKNMKSWFFIVCAFISTIFIGLTGLYQIVECFYDLVVSFVNFSNNNDYLTQIFIPQIIKTILLFVFSGIVFFPLFKSLLIHKHND